MARKETINVDVIANNLPAILVLGGVVFGILSAYTNFPLFTNNWFALIILGLFAYLAPKYWYSHK